MDVLMKSKVLTMVGVVTLKREYRCRVLAIAGHEKGWVSEHRIKGDNKLTIVDELAHD